MAGGEPYSEVLRLFNKIRRSNFDVRFTFKPDVFCKEKLKLFAMTSAKKYVCNLSFSFCIIRESFRKAGNTAPQSSPIIW